MSRPLILWSHGLESGPWGTKITHLAKTAQALGFASDSVDYRGLDQAADRVDRLLARLKDLPEPPLLAGSSMGGYVAVAAACRAKARGLFLLAPALYLPRYGTGEVPVFRGPTAIVHGWRDDAVPPDNSFRYAALAGADLHLLDGSHRLTEHLPALDALLTLFLGRFS